MLGNGNRAVIELAEELAAVVPVDEPHFLFASDGARRGGAGAQDRVPVLGERRRDRSHAVPRVRRRVPRGHDRFALASAPAASAPTSTTRCGSRCCARPRSTTPAASTRPCALIAEHASELAAVVVEPLVQGAAGMLLGDPEGLRTLGEACAEHDVLLICDEVATGFGRTGTLFASEQCGLRPDLLCIAKGITGGYLPMSATVANRRVLRRVPRRRPRAAHLLPRPLVRGERARGRGGTVPPSARDTGRRARERRRAFRAAARRCSKTASASHQAVREIRVCGLMAGIELAPPEPDLRWGRRVTAATVERGVLVRPIGDVVILVPPLTITEPGDRAHRRRARRRDRRDGHAVGGAEPSARQESAKGPRSRERR